MTDVIDRADASPHPVVSERHWLEARKALLEKEKAFTRERDALNAARRALPWVQVEKDYAFDTTAGRRSLGEMFGPMSQLIVYHFMFGPGWEQGCPSCSFLADHFDGATVHLAQRDVRLVVASRAPLPQIQAFRKRMGWKFDWVSSGGGDFNFDYHVSFRDEDRIDGKVDYNYSMMAFPVEEAHGLSAFHKDNAGRIFHTYSTYGRGLDLLIGTYNFLDLAPKGRDEDDLPFTMSWVRHHDRYDRRPDLEAGLTASGEGCCSGG